MSQWIDRRGPVTQHVVVYTTLILAAIAGPAWFVVMWLLWRDLSNDACD